MNSKKPMALISVVICSGFDISTPEGVEYAKENNLFTNFCPEMVKSAAGITEEILGD